MARSYELDTSAAKKADEKSSRIDATGDYIGQFKYAIAVKSDKKGTDGIELHFEDQSKQEAKLTLWTHKGDGTPLTGNNTVQAIMTCLSLRGMSAQPGQVEVYDHQSKARLKKQVDIYPDLMGKRIGLLLQAEPEEYLDRQNALKVANKLSIYGVYQADSKLTSSEILTRANKPEKLEKMKASLKDRPLKKLAASNAAPTGSSTQAGGDDEFDDSDIPF